MNWDTSGDDSYSGANHAVRVVKHSPAVNRLQAPVEEGDSSDMEIDSPVKMIR